MSVIVEDLVKTYGSQNAVDHISFEAKKGRILGFLGPNGAGKTTTMKMITGYLVPTSGKVKVCDIDVVEEPLAAASKIGYLPENNPLYTEMYVKEYLAFVGGLHKISNVRAKVDEMIELTGLQREQHKRIHQLSKGYRQRVGLAQAMIHNPEVLILDEPTSGLDPNQLAEIRQLIKQLGQEKTVIFSTHIMQEVKALCDSVVIIDRGQIVANDLIGDLEKRITGKVAVTVQFDKDCTLKDLARIEGVLDVESLGGQKYKCTSDAEVDIRPGIFQFAVRTNLVILELRKETFSVEKVFQKLTNVKVSG